MEKLSETVSTTLRTLPHHPTIFSMDVIFEPQRGRSFSIEVGFFDTVLEIKEKVQKYQGIPVARQTLVFKGRVLQDEQDIEYCELLQDSHVQLLVAPEPDKTQVKPQIHVEQPSPVASNKIQLKINIPSSKTCVPLEIDVNDTILRLKEKIHEMENVPINRLVSGQWSYLAVLDWCQVSLTEINPEFVIAG